MNTTPNTHFDYPARKVVEAYRNFCVEQDTWYNVRDAIVIDEEVVEIAYEVQEFVDGSDWTDPMFNAVIKELERTVALEEGRMTR